MLQLPHLSHAPFRTKYLPCDSFSTYLRSCFTSIDASLTLASQGANIVGLHNLMGLQVSLASGENNNVLNEAVDPAWPKELSACTAGSDRNEAIKALSLFETQRGRGLSLSQPDVPSKGTRQSTSAVSEPCRKPSRRLSRRPRTFLGSLVHIYVSVNMKWYMAARMNLQCDCARKPTG